MFVQALTITGYHDMFEENLSFKQFAQRLEMVHGIGHFFVGGDMWVSKTMLGILYSFNTL
jgi:hypothetical protein